MIQQRKLLFLINGHAGKGAIRMHLLQIVDCFVRAGYEPTLYTTQRSGELPGVVRDRAREFDLIVCSGGDGTLNETINGLMQVENPPVLGYIPAGTTNDFANSLSIPKNMVKAAEAAVEGVTVHVDVGHFCSRYFAYVAAFGAFTDVSYATPQDAKNLLGRLAYVLEGAQRLTSLETHRLRVEYDGGAETGEFLVGLISNSSYVAGLPFGKLMDASMNDGLLDVLLVRKPDLMIELTRVVSGLLRGELDSKLIFSVKTRHVHIISEEPIPWTLDGEYGGTRVDVLIDTRTRALRVNVPGESVLPDHRKNRS